MKKVMRDIILVIAQIGIFATSENKVVTLIAVITLEICVALSMLDALD